MKLFSNLGLATPLLLCLIFHRLSASDHGENGHGADSGGSSHDGAGQEGEHSEQDGTSGEESHHGGQRFRVAKFEFLYVKTPFIVGIWILYAICARLFFHWEKHLSKIFPESCLLIITGVIFGVILYLVGEKMYEVNTTIFFLVLLPPIILDAGYYMPARAFFDQLGTILLYAILGTLLNTLLLGFALWGVYQGGGFENLTSPLLLFHSLVLGSLLAAVDPVAVLAVFESVHVNEMLYIIVFGESLLNDGISVVLYHLFEGYSEIGIENIQGIDVVAGIASFLVIVFGATGIGMLLGLLAGFISRFTKNARKMEPLLVLVIGYLSFIIAEMFHLSGIISCTFCGITMRKYVEANYSEKSNKAVHIVLKMFAQASEIIVFMYIGMSAVSDIHHWDTAFCILTLVLCLIFRTICVIGQTYFANMIRVVKLTKIDQFVMAYGGLRGAIAFALVLLLDHHEFPHRKMFITTTVLVIYFTNLAMGSTIEPLVKFLKVKRQLHRKPAMGEKIVSRFTDYVMSGLEDITGQSGHHQLRERFSTWNNNFLKPLIVGKKNPQRQGWQILSVYNKINAKAAKHHLKRSETGNSLLVRDMSCLDLNSRAPSSYTLSGSAFPHASHGPAVRGNWWESNVSISRTLQQDMMEGENIDETLHHISEDIAGPILRVNKVGSTEKQDSIASEEYSPTHDEPIIFGKYQRTQSNNDSKNRHGVERVKKSVSFLDLGAIVPQVNVISDGVITMKQDGDELPIPWKSLGDEDDADPIRSPSAGMMPPNLRAFLASDGEAMDPPPAYGLNGYKNYTFQNDEGDSSDEEKNNKNNNNNYPGYEDAWYLDENDEKQDESARMVVYNVPSSEVRVTRGTHQNMRPLGKNETFNSVVVHSLTPSSNIEKTNRKKTEENLKDDFELVVDATNLSSQLNKY